MVTIYLILQYWTARSPTAKTFLESTSYIVLAKTNVVQQKKRVLRLSIQPKTTDSTQNLLWFWVELAIQPKTTLFVLRDSIQKIADSAQNASGFGLNGPFNPKPLFAFGHSTLNFSGFDLKRRDKD